MLTNLTRTAVILRNEWTQHCLVNPAADFIGIFSVFCREKYLRISCWIAVWLSETMWIAWRGWSIAYCLLISDLVQGFFRIFFLKGTAFKNNHWNKYMVYVVKTTLLLLTCCLRQIFGMATRMSVHAVKTLHNCSHFHQKMCQKWKHNRISQMYG